MSREIKEFGVTNNLKELGIKQKLSAIKVL
jgi:hypothetical protein